MKTGIPFTSMKLKTESYKVPSGAFLKDPSLLKAEMKGQFETNSQSLKFNIFTIIESSSANL